MELTEILLQENNLELATKLAEVIPLAKASLEYKFWKAYYETYHKQIEDLGFRYVEDNFFEKGKEEALGYIAYIRKKKDGDFPFQYEIQKDAEQELYLWIGQEGRGRNIYMSLELRKKGEHVPVANWNVKLVKQVEGIGFTEGESNKDYYIQTELNFTTVSIYKLQSQDTFEETLRQVGEELVKKAEEVARSLLKEYT